MSNQNEKNMTPISYCAEFVKQNDPDRFILSLFCDESCREALWALFAFNYEISKTREVVSESTLGHIRLQWWRDEIAKIFDTNVTQGNEILSALADAIQRYNLPKEDFDKLIYAREFDLENVLPADMQGFTNYCDFTTTPLMTLVLLIVGGDLDNESVRDVAINYAASGLLRSVPFHAKQGRAYLPENLLNDGGITKDELFSFQKKKEISEIVRKLTEECITPLKSDNVFLKSSDILADLYFRQIKGLNYDVFAPKLQVSPAFKVLRLYVRTKYLR